MKTANNFKPKITQDLANKIYNLVNDFDYRDLPFNFEMLSGDYNLTEIEGNFVSGWIPRQDGGFKVSTPILSVIDYSITSKQLELHQKVYKEWEVVLKEAIASGEIDGSEESIWVHEQQYYQDNWYDIAYLELQCYTKDGKTIVEFIIEHMEIEILASLEYNNIEFIATDNEIIINDLFLKLKYIK